MQQLDERNLRKPLRIILMIVFFPVTIYYLTGIYLYKSLGLIVFGNKKMYFLIKNQNQQPDPEQIVIPALYQKPGLSTVLAFPLAIPCLFVYLSVQFLALFMFLGVILVIGSFVFAIQFIISLFLNMCNKILEGLLLLKKSMLGVITGIKFIFAKAISNTVSAIKFVFIEIWRGVNGD